MSIIWNDELKTGIPVIDEQHQFIVESLSSVEISRLTDEEIIQLLDNLKAYLSIHFDVEEDYMIDADYPKYELHKSNHDKVLEDYKTILNQKDCNHNQKEVALKLINYMENWFIDHYANEDVKLVAFLKENIWRINK